MKAGLIALSLVVAFGGPTMAQDFRPTLDRIKDTGAADLGYRESSPPFSPLDKDRWPVGYAIDLCLQVVEEVRDLLRITDLRIKWVPLTPASRIALRVKRRLRSRMRVQHDHLDPDGAG